MAPLTPYMKGYLSQPRQQHQACQLLSLTHSTLFIATAMLLLSTPAIAAGAQQQQQQQDAAHSPVQPLADGGAAHATSSSSSSTGIIIGVVVGVVGTLLVGGFVAFLCLLRRRRRLLHRRGGAHAYADADSIALQDGHSSIHHHHHGAPSANLREGSEETAGLYSHHTIGSNEPVTPPQTPALTSPQMRDRRDNYADRSTQRTAANSQRHNDNDESGGGYDNDDDAYANGTGVRPASPNAERVDGVAIENRVRPRRHLPRGRITVQQGDQDVCLDFSGVQRVPQAGPPPLTHEEKQRMLDAQARVASPEFYGRAEYEYRRASNTNTPNVLLSSSMLRELQQQYAAASAAGQIFPSYASETGHSVGSMSFRPGSPAGSVRRGQRDGRQSTSPNSVTLSTGQNLRHRHTSSRPHTHSRDAVQGSGGYAHTSAQRHHRHHRDDLESTSDDFEDLSLHNDDSFAGRRDRTRDASSGGGSRFPPPASAFPVLGGSLGVDHMSRGSNSPAVFERFLSGNGSVHGRAGLNGSVISGYGVPSPLDGPQASPAGLLHGQHTPQGLRAIQSTTITSPVMWCAAGDGSLVYPTTPQAPPAAASAAGANNNNNNNNNGVSGNTHTAATSTSFGSATPPKSSSASPGAGSTLPAFVPPSPSNPIIRFIADPTSTSSGGGDAGTPS